MSQSISLPHQILRGADAIHKIETNIDKTIQRVLVIGGKHALKACQAALSGQFECRERIQFAWYGGEVSESNCEVLIKQASEQNAQLIIAAGGGKAIDMGKWVAEVLGLPVVTIPTIAATCSAVSTVSIKYDDRGHYIDVVKLKKAPSLVVLDPSIIVQAPVRWLAAGLGDTLAKLYEFRAIQENLSEGSFNDSAYANGQLCFDLIKKYGPDAIKAVENKCEDKALVSVMDAIFIFAGFTSIMGVGDHVGAAHGLFDGFTINEKTRLFGHGLLVGFGNLVLLDLEGRSEDQLIEAILLARACAIPVALNEINSLTDDELFAIAEFAAATPDMKNMPFTVTALDLVTSMKKISALSEAC